MASIAYIYTVGDDVEEKEEEKTNAMKRFFEIYIYSFAVFFFFSSLSKLIQFSMIERAKKRKKKEKRIELDTIELTRHEKRILFIVIFKSKRNKIKNEKLPF